MKKHHKSFLRLLSLVTLVVTLSVSALLPMSADAAQITTRSLELVAGATDGGSMPGGVVNHKFTFTLPTSGNVGSIEFKYCTTAADSGTNVCITPTGLSTSGATIGSQAGATGFTINTTTNGAPYLTRTAALVSGPQIVTVQLNGITNPTEVNGETFFVRITTYDAAALGGSIVDFGTVAAATNRGIDLTGTMPESLVFCTGTTIAKTLGVPDCSTVTSGAVLFNQLFSPTDTATATSQMAASTNAGLGYAITVNGPTMGSGTNSIPAMNTAGATNHGIGQFGLNLKANTTATSTVAVGTEVDATPNGLNYRGQAATGYDTIDTFKFTTGDTVAKSDNGSVGGSDAQIFTVSYIVNVPGSQPAGTYTTTLTYICTPTF